MTKSFPSLSILKSSLKTTDNPPVCSGCGCTCPCECTDCDVCSPCKSH